MQSVSEAYWQDQYRKATRAHAQPLILDIVYKPFDSLEVSARALKHG